jgi:hypothetical protein
VTIQIHSYPLRSDKRESPRREAVASKIHSYPFRSDKRERHGTRPQYLCSPSNDKLKHIGQLKTAGSFWEEPVKFAGRPAYYDAPVSTTAVRALDASDQMELLTAQAQIGGSASVAG